MSQFASRGEADIFRITRDETDLPMKTRVLRTVALSSLALSLAAVGCNGSGDSKQDTAQVAQNPEAANPNAPILLRGTVTSVSANQIVLKSDTGSVTVAVTQPFHLYTRGPSDLAHVKE